MAAKRTFVMAVTVAYFARHSGVFCSAVEKKFFTFHRGLHTWKNRASSRASARLAHKIARVLEHCWSVLRRRISGFSQCWTNWCYKFDFYTINRSNPYIRGTGDACYRRARPRASTHSFVEEGRAPTRIPTATPTLDGEASYDGPWVSIPSSFC
jgi:hypothetical protein